MMAYKVFISYSTKNFTSVDTLRSWLQLPEVEVFVSEYAVVPGAPLAPAIKEAIQKCDLFVLLWSKEAAASEWVPQEIGMAHGSNKQILPFVLETVPLPGFIKDLRYVPANRNTQEALNWLRDYVQSNSVKHNQQQALGILALGGLLLLLFKGK